MGAEFLAAMSDSDGMSFSFDHDVTRQVVGDIESLRAKLTDALEEKGYRVLNESPLQARRSAKSSAQSGCSQNILDYQTFLEVGLKSSGANSTRVTFAYTVKGVYSGYMTKGDRNTLTREAEAIIATGLARTVIAHCSACGADTSGSSRFCRQCGAPLSVAIPAETEVLRLTSKANASQKTIGTGLAFFLMAAALLVVLLFGSDNPANYAKLVKVIGTLSAVLGTTGILLAFWGWFKLRQMINRPIEQDTPPVFRRKVIEGIIVPDTNELPPASIQYPVTEATTDLLPQEIKRAS